MKFAYLSLALSAVNLPSIEASNSLRGKKHTDVTQTQVDGFEQLKCLLEGMTEKNKCFDSFNVSGDPCFFCYMKAPDGEEGGVCVDPTVAPQMKELNPNFICKSGGELVDFDTITSSKNSDVDVQDYKDFKCSIKGFNNPKKCSQMKTEDKTENCQYCTMEGPFGESGLCVSPEHAEAIKSKVPTVNCSEGSEQQDAAKEAQVRGWSELKCMFEGMTDKDKCADSYNASGDECSFCVMKADDGSEAGICVDPSVAPTMEQMNPAIKCDEEGMSDIAAEVKVKEYKDFKCSIKGFNDPKKCSHMKTEDGTENCQYCSMEGPFGKTGICVSPEHAEAIKTKAPTLECSEGVVGPTFELSNSRVE